MKWFCRILALYILVLAGFPCSDGEHSHEAQQSHERCNDLCTPLCQCSCCGSVVLALKMAATFSHSAVIPGDKSAGYAYQTPFSNDHSAVLFRPPIAMLG